MRRARRALSVTFLPAALGATLLGAQAAPRLYGDVTVSRERITFSLAGQLWDVPRAGGTARRLSTSDDEYGYPLYSPDGSQLAYVRGNAVWVSMADGSNARRLTWYPRFTRPRAWSPDGRTILMVSSRDGDGSQRAITIPSAGGPETMLSLSPVRFATYAPDGKRLAIVARSPFLDGVDRRFYRGGMSDPIQLVDPATGRGRSLPRGSANVIHPMWVGERIYFLSDSLGSFNLAVHELATGRTRLLTSYRSAGITAAGAGGNAIVFVRDGRLHLHDIGTGSVSTPDIRVQPDTAQLASRTVNASAFVTSMSAGPRGEQVAVEARARVVLLDTRTGVARQLSRMAGGIAERTPVVSPDGQRVAYMSDEGGEYALHVRSLDEGAPARVIRLGSTPIYGRGLTWSPDSRRIAVSDQRLVLWVADVAAGRATPVDSSRWIAQGLWQASWSPDGRWLAYAKADPKGTRSVWLRDVESGQAWQLSRGGSDDSWPVIDPSGRWLYFASSSTAGNAPARDVWALQSDLLAQPWVTSTVMVTTLRAGDVLPMLSYQAGANPAAAQPAAGAFDVPGASRRIAPLGTSPRNIEQLWMASSGALVAQVTSWPTTTPFDNATSELLRIEPGSPRRPVTLAQGLRGAEVSADGSTALVLRGGGWQRVGVLGTGSDTAKVDLSRLALSVEPRAEWGQLYHEAFRMMRDYFYDPAHHGVDLTALETRYAAYLPQLTRRSELNDLLTYAFGEVSISHLQVGGGDQPRPASQNERTGVLGADVEVAEGRYRFTRIMRNGPYQSDNALLRAPLDQPGSEVRVGEYLLAVDGTPVTVDRPVEAFLVGKATRPTVLRVGQAADGSGARDVMVVPSPGENGLRRANWAEANRAEVERRSSGALAYVYVDGWGPGGFSELSRVVNGSPRARGLIIDQRFNGGGITPDAAVELLLRRPWYDYLYRYGDGFAVPHHLIEGPKVVIAHEANGSAAETFALMFKEQKAGTIVGRRTAGGGIGGALFAQRLADGGRVTIPNRASYSSRTGQWVVENHGVEPDVDVPLTQEDAVAGRDPQLARAIEVALSELKRFKPAVRTRPKMPMHPEREP